MRPNCSNSGLRSFSSRLRGIWPTKSLMASRSFMPSGCPPGGSGPLLPTGEGRGCRSCCCCRRASLSVRRAMTGEGGRRAQDRAGGSGRRADSQLQRRTPPPASLPPGPRALLPPPRPLAPASGPQKGASAAAPGGQRAHSHPAHSALLIPHSTSRVLEPSPGWVIEATGPQTPPSGWVTAGLRAGQT